MALMVKISFGLVNERCELTNPKRKSSDVV